jgi:hypothetical protein
MQQQHPHGHRHHYHRPPIAPPQPRYPESAPDLHWTLGQMTERLHSTSQVLDRFEQRLDRIEQHQTTAAAQLSALSGQVQEQTQAIAAKAATPAPTPPLELWILKAIRYAAFSAPVVVLLKTGSIETALQVLEAAKQISAVIK